MAARDPQQEKRFLRRWLRRRHPSLRKNGTIVLLPRQVRCFGGELLLSLPADFRPQRVSGSKILASGRQTNMTLTVEKLPFRRPLRQLSAVDLHMAFASFGLPPRLPDVEHGFLHHSPTLTAVWDYYPANKITVLHLIQVQKTVFLLLFQDLTAEQEDDARAMIYALSLAPR